MTTAIDTPRETSLAGWPFWASMIAHLVGIGAVSAVAVTSAAPPPPVPIELVTIEQPVPAEAPKPTARQGARDEADPSATDDRAGSRAVRAPVVARRRAARPRARRARRSPPRPIAASSRPPRPGWRHEQPRRPAPARSSRPAIFPSWPGAGRPEVAAGTAPARRSSSTGSAAGLTEFARPLGGYQTTPRYPESARRQGVEGITTLRFVVLATGHVGQIAVSRSAGHVDLDRAAVEAVRTWRFEPARRGKEAVAVWVTLPVRFELHNE